MYVKRTVPVHEIIALADELRPLIKQGESVRPFLRRNEDVLRRIVQQESWATLAAVMTTLGMTYITGTPWTARTIEKALWKASKPLKARGGARTPAPAARTSPVADAQLPSVEAPRDPLPEAALPAIPATTGPAPAPPKRGFVLKQNPRLPPPPSLTEEEIARRQALDERLFGKKG